MVKSMKAVRFRFVSIKNFRWIGIYVFRTFTIPPIYDFFSKKFGGRTLVKYIWLIVFSYLNYDLM